MQQVERGTQRQWKVLALAAVALACSGKSRPFSNEPIAAELAEQPMAPAAGSPEQGQDSPIPALTSTQEALLPGSLGAPCTGPTDCTAPSQCVDGVCCSSACADLCAACGHPGSIGTCSAAPSDEACPALQCAGFDTECRKLDQSQLPLNCEAFGSCKVEADCAAIAEPAGTPCQAGVGACDGSGACLVEGRARLGAVCVTDADCAEGHCVPGPDGASLCCDAPCDGACQACSAAGHCEITPATDGRCEAVACPPDDVCRDYTADVTVSQCRAFGQCQTGLDCAFVALRPEAECLCDADTGACGLRNGAACTADGECDSGACVIGGQGTTICCASACGAGLFCGANGAQCVECEGDIVECQGNVEQRCNGGVIAATECPNGCTPGIGCNSLPPLGFACPDGQCAAPNVCQQDAAGQPRCCSRDCAAEGKICAQNGSCVCQPGQVQAGDDCLLQAGDPCQDSEQCGMGATCADGVCCQEACTGPCERCEPNTGLCVAVGQGQQDPQCGNGRQCTGARGDCRLGVRQPCNGNGAECTTSNCEPTVGNATQICCAQACSGNRPFCRSDGTGCVQCENNADCGNGCNTFTGLCNALLPVGTPCATTSQCDGGAQCLLDQSGQTRCCARNCAAEGLLCNGAGQCVAPAPATLATVGLPPEPFPQTAVGSASTTTRLWVVQNTGASATAPLSLNASPEFTTSGNCLGLVLQPSASCSLTISFAPQQPGTRQATLTLSGGPGVALSLGVTGEARVRDGGECPGLVSLCESRTCTEWFPDPDGDGFGSLEVVSGIPSKSVCGGPSAANQPPPFILVGACRGSDVEIPYVLRNTTPGIVNGGLDCCDRFFRCDSSGATTLTPDTSFPGQVTPQGEGASCGSAPGAGHPSDFDCDGEVTPVSTSTGRSAVGLFDAAPCATLTTAAECTAASGRTTGPPTCGPATIQACNFSAAGRCSAVNGAAIRVLCL